MSFKICKFCGYKPNLPIKRMLIWGTDLCCDGCFKELLKKSSVQGSNSLPEASESNNSPKLQGLGGDLKKTSQ